MGKENKQLELGNVHAVPGARKPVVRFALAGVKIELSIDNSAAVANTTWMSNLNQDPCFCVLLRLTRALFRLNELSKIGRLSSYACALLITTYLTSVGVLEPIAESVKNKPQSDLIDPVCQKTWNYTQPATDFKWPKTALPEETRSLGVFVDFVTWLAHANFDQVINARTAQFQPPNGFMAAYEVIFLGFEKTRFFLFKKTNKKIFKKSSE